MRDPIKTLFILNEGSYGSERSYNALRLASAPAKKEGQSLRLFLIGDGVVCGQGGQSTPDGFYNIERMLKGLIRKGAEGAV